MASSKLNQCEVLLDQYFDPGVQWNASLDGKLRSLVREHDECAVAYDKAVTVHRLMVGASPELPSGFERNRMMDAVVEAAIGPQRSIWSLFTLPSFSLGAAMATGLAAILIVFAGPQMMERIGITKDVKETAYIGARGVLGPELRGGIGLSGVTESELEYEITATGTNAYIEDYLRVYTTRLDPELEYAFVFGVQETSPLWYWPDPANNEGTKSMLVPQGELKLSGRHQTGTLKVVALFTVQPVELNAVADALANELSMDTLEERLRNRLGLSEPNVIRVITINVVAGSKGEDSNEL